MIDLANAEHISKKQHRGMGIPDAAF